MEWFIKWLVRRRIASASFVVCILILSMRINFSLDIRRLGHSYADRQRKFQWFGEELQQAGFQFPAQHQHTSTGIQRPNEFPRKIKFPFKQQSDRCGVHRCGGSYGASDAEGLGRVENWGNPKVAVLWEESDRMLELCRPHRETYLRHIHFNSKTRIFLDSSKVWNFVELLKKYRSSKSSKSSPSQPNLQGLMIMQNAAKDGNLPEVLRLFEVAPKNVYLGPVSKPEFFDKDSLSAARQAKLQRGVERLCEILGLRRSRAVVWEDATGSIWIFLGEDGVKFHFIYYMNLFNHA